MDTTCDYKDFCLKALPRKHSIERPEFKCKVASLTSQRIKFRKEIQERKKAQRLLKNAYKI